MIWIVNEVKKNHENKVRNTLLKCTVVCYVLRNLVRVHETRVCEILKRMWLPVLNQPSRAHPFSKAESAALKTQHPYSHKHKICHFWKA